MFSRALLLLILGPALLRGVEEEPRRIPPVGVTIPESERAELTASVSALGEAIAATKSQLARNGNAALERLLPDVEIFHKAVDWALRYDEFFDVKQVATGRELLALGKQRAHDLSEGNALWLAATGLVVRGYRSRIDDSVQPYGMVVPDDWKVSDRTPRRLDFWFRGRAEKSTELGFIDDRLKGKGEFVPPGAFVLHPFGRFCNANKFAGEVDLFEALDHARRDYPIDEKRLTVRGFSMGGAATWQFGTHYPGMWAAVAPGAGFAETAEFFKVFASGKEPPPWWEQVLWRWYDSTTMAANLGNVPTVAYSGEIDGQKQAADIMTRFAEKEGVTFTHIIGPQTAHKYHPDSKPKIEEFVTGAVESRPPLRRTQDRFVTYSLIYPQAEGFRITGLEKQWERAEISLVQDPSSAALKITTQNVSGFALRDSGDRGLLREISVDGTVLPFSPSGSAAGFIKKDGKWQLTERAGDVGPFTGPVRKRRALCGPVDHAFMARFLFVRPTGKPLNDLVGAWTKSEMEHAQKFWRQVFRGDAPIKDDIDVTADDIANANLVVWGDPSSNQLLKNMSALSVNPGGHKDDPLGLPYQWSAEQLVMNGAKYDAAQHAPILIFPNPLNPEKYLVLNSGVTFREAALLNNSDQTPKLPDWAIVDLRTPPNARSPGAVVDAGFFDEAWKFSH